jgi:perosamine synthetase
MIPLAIPNLCGKEAIYLQECVTTGFVSSVGPFVTRMEELVAQAVGTPASVATSAGTTGLHLALVTLGVQPGDLVIIPSYSFIATGNAVRHAGAIPWLFDISSIDWCIDPNLLRDELLKHTEKRTEGLFHKASGRRVAALMPVYALGLIPDMKPFREIASDFDLRLIADAAPAIGAQRDGKSVGVFADLTVFSFNGNKTVTCGGGGAIAGMDKAVLARAKHLSSTARSGDDYTHDAVGFNYRMTNISAAVGCAQMENLPLFIAAKRRIRDRYNQAFSDLSALSFFPEAPDKGNACWFSGFVLPADGSIPFAPLAAKLNAAGVQCRSFWKPIHLQVPHQDSPMTAMPVCDALWKRIAVLPSSTQLSDDEQSEVIRQVRLAFQ